MENQAEYAAAHGYEHRIVVQPHWTHLHPSFSKVHEIGVALAEGFDRVIWFDADVAVMDMTVDLAKLLEPDYFMAAYRQNNWPAWPYLCAGLTLWRGDDRARRFIAEMRERCEIGSPSVRPGERVIITHAPYEQWFQDEIVRETNYAGIRPCEATEIGCFASQIWNDGVIWKPGMPTVHFAGPSTWEKRREVFLEHYRPHVRR
jgi:hypothetical protein